MGTNCRQDSKYVKCDTGITLQVEAILLYIKYLGGTTDPNGCEGHTGILTFLTSKKNLLMFPISI